MKIQLINAAPEHFSKQTRGRWHFFPMYFEKFGHKVLHTTRKKLWKFYFDYLSFKPDILIVSGISSAFPILLKKLGLIRKPIIMDWNDYYTEVSGKYKNPALTSFLEYYSVKNADVVVSPGPSFKAIGEKLRKEIKIIPHGVTDEFDITKKKKLKTKNNLFYGGELSRYKGTDKLIGAVKGLNCTLYLAGQVGDISIKNLPKNVIYLGKLDRKELVEYINSADICIDLQETDTSLKLFEYIYKKKPILSLSGRKAYLMTHLEDTFMAKSLSKKDLRNAINSLFKSRELRGKMEKNISKIKVFKWVEIAKIYNALLKEKTARWTR